MFTKQERLKLAGDIAKSIGKMLGQEYRQIEGEWWLISLGKAIAVLKPDEVQWHVRRNHAPFVPGGITVDDPRWFDDPPLAL